MFDFRLKKLRESKDFTQKEIAHMIGIPTRTYASYENNEREPNSDVLIKLSKIFDISLDYLLGINEFIKSQYDDAAIKMYMQLDNIDRAEIRGEMKQMLKSGKYISDIYEDELLAAKTGEIIKTKSKTYSTDKEKEIDLLMSEIENQDYN